MTLEPDMRHLKRVLWWLYHLLGGGGTLDPFADKFAAVKKRPPQRNAAARLPSPNQTTTDW